MAAVLVLDYPQARPDRLAQALRHLGVDVTVTSDPRDVHGAERLIVPDGDDGDRALERGLDRDLLSAIREVVDEGRHLLTIGLGSMLLFEGHTHPSMPPGLGVYGAPIQRFDPRMTDEHERPLKAPHTGFGYVVGLDRHEILGKAVPVDEQGCWLYFRHRLCAPARVPFADVAVAHHGVPFAAAVWKERLVSLTFLPELSGPVGIELLRTWAEASAP